MNKTKLVFVVFVYNIKKRYYGRPELALAKVYIDKHWQEEFDSKVLAKAVHMSERQLFRLFKEQEGISPGDYYNKCKVEHLKEKLIDKSLNIKEVFAACGVDSQGWFPRVFKKMTGKTPSQYRKVL
jgi:two-component system response regulator YesN